MRPLCIVIALGVVAVAGCGGSNQESEPEEEAASTAKHGLECSLEDVKGVSFDLRGDPPSSRSPDAALAAFLRREGASEAVSDFHLGEQSKARADFAYEPDSEKLGAIYVTRVHEGWTVVGYEFCRGALSIGPT